METRKMQFQWEPPENEDDFPYATFHVGGPTQGFKFSGCIDKADAERIVAAWNSHDELLTACKELVAWADRYGHCDVSWPGHLAQVIKLAEAAIAKAEGGGK